MKPLTAKVILILFLAASTQMCQAQDKPKENCGNTKATTKIPQKKMSQLNVLGTPIALASVDPLTGYFRNGYCQTGENDYGLHVVAAVVTDDFLQYSKSQGNDLITPYPSSGFPGLKAGDVWCLCVMRWRDAYEAGFAPPVILEATNAKALQYVTLEQLKSIQNTPK
jgi:uncharacterized protein